MLTEHAGTLCMAVSLYIALSTWALSTVLDVKQESIYLFIYLKNHLIIFSKNLITYSTTKSVNPLSRSKSLGSTNSHYNSLISSLLNKDPTYVVLISNSEDTSVSFLHVRALCPVPPQFPQRRTVGWAFS